MTGATTPDEADALYRPLGGLGPWAAAPPSIVDAPEWSGPDGPERRDMAARGAALAAAHQSGALDGLYDADRGLAMALIRGVRTVSTVGDEARAHVVANHRALGLVEAATDHDLGSEAWIRKLHDVACTPQLTHRVHGDHGDEDHVLAAGVYKHHPNHLRTSDGWVARAPVSSLRREMDRFLEMVTSPGFAELQPVARAAYAHHAMTHIAPFEDGNGRVARLLASAHLLRAASVPFLVFADDPAGYDLAMARADAGDPAALVAVVGGRARALVDLLAELYAGTSTDPDLTAALADWRRRAGAGALLAGLLPAAVEQALDRHRRRPDLGWLSSLADVEVAPAPAGVTVRHGGTGVAEELSVDAHPVLDVGALELRAVHARLHLHVRPEELDDPGTAGVRSRLDPWLDRALSTLALRVAAELE